MKALSEQQISHQLRELNEGLSATWLCQGGKLHKEYLFPSFMEAFGFMSQVALIAESNNHHPEWFNVYNKVIVDLASHEVAGISEADVDLARAMDAVASRLLSK